MAKKKDKIVTKKDEGKDWFGVQVAVFFLIFFLIIVAALIKDSLVKTEGEETCSENNMTYLEHNTAEEYVKCIDNDHIERTFIIGNLKLNLGFECNNKSKAVEDE